MSPSPPEREELLRKLEQKEVALVRAVMSSPDLLDMRGEAAIRTALSLARLYRVRGPDGEVDVEATVEPLRDEVLRLLDVAGLDKGEKPVADKLRPIGTILREQAQRVLDALYHRYAASLPREVIDREVRQKALVLALGGGGGTGYIYWGAFKLLEECGWRPSLIAGTSIGTIVGLFRARTVRYETADVLAVTRSLSWNKVFQLLSMESRYGLPAAMSLYLKAAVGKLFEGPDGQPMQLKDLPIPLIATVSGIRSGVLPRPLEFYEKLLGDVLGSPTPLRIAKTVPKVAGALVELIQLSERLEKLYLGLEAGTEEFDAVDAAGFSASLPGVVHYDVVRQDARMHELLGAIFARHDLFRLTDGCLVDNVPARAAWLAVQKGRVGTRNAFVLALDAFAPKLSTPQWLALQSIVMQQVQRSCSWSHLYHAFRWTPSPLELIPSVGAAVKFFERGKDELSEELPFITRMLQPLPPLD